MVAQALEDRSAAPDEAHVANILPYRGERTNDGAVSATQCLERASSDSGEDARDLEEADHSPASSNRRAALREEWQLSGYWRRSSRGTAQAMESRRKARKARWEQMAVAGAAAGVSPITL